jgi:hypothetical protein
MELGLHEGKHRRLRIFENGVLRKLFEPKKEEVAQRWKELHMRNNEEQYDLDSSSYIIRVIKLRRLR